MDIDDAEAIALLVVRRREGQPQTQPVTISSAAATANQGSQRPLIS